MGELSYYKISLWRVGVKISNKKLIAIAATGSHAYTNFAVISVGGILNDS